MRSLIHLSKDLAATTHDCPNSTYNSTLSPLIHHSHLEWTVMGVHNPQMCQAWENVMESENGGDGNAAGGNFQLLQAGERLA